METKNMGMKKGKKKEVIPIQTWERATRVPGCLSYKTGLLSWADWKGGAEPTEHERG